MSMRSRPTARPKPATLPTPPSDSSAAAHLDEDDLKKKQQPIPRKSKFRLPPPPKLTSVSFPTTSSASTNRDASANNRSSTDATPTNGDSTKQSSNGSSAHKDEEMGNASTNDATRVNSQQLPPPPSLPIPSPQPQPTKTSAYQRVRNQTPSVMASSFNNELTIDDGADDDTFTSISMVTNRSTYTSNPYAYKPSKWYADSRRIQKNQQRLQNALIVTLAVVSIGFLWWHFHNLHTEQKHHHREYHHHDVKRKMEEHNHLHAMVGIVDNPAGFALYSKTVHEKHKEEEKKKLTQEQTQQQQQQQPQQQQGTRHVQQEQAGEHIEDTSLTSNNLLFSHVPVVTLSNSRLLPHIGFGVAGHIEHKEIPLIVSRLLQYASSENEGGGGIAMVDAVMDERVDNSETAEDEKLEMNMSKTVVALVGRAIGYFAKENMSNHRMEVKAASVNVGEDNNPSSYDYENRLEVHLLVCLSNSELGRENSLKALSDITAELEGLVPPAPHDLDHLDSTSWRANAVDRRVDTRLHVLLRLPECYNKDHEIVPCASDKTTNSKLLQRWIDSWGVLEKLYEANILHGIGVDGTTEGDLKLLLKHCRIVPQMYRGDVSQALDGYGRKMGVHTFNEERRVEKLLKEKNITFLASNVAGHVLEKKDQAPNAHGLLQILGKILLHSHRELMASQGGVTSNSNEEYYTVPRLALAYLVRHGVVALPHAYKPEHLVDDAPESVGGLASFLKERRVAEIGVALKALVTGRDLPEDHGLGTEDEDAVAVVFHNELDQDVTLMQLVHENKMVEDEIEKGVIEKGDSVVIIAKPGDEFEVFQSDGSRFDGYQVHAEKGGADDFTISSAK